MTLSDRTRMRAAAASAASIAAAPAMANCWLQSRPLAPVIQPDTTAASGAQRATIARREKDIEQLNAERGQFDRGALVRGAVVLGGALVVPITLVCVAIAVASRV